MKNKRYIATRIGLQDGLERYLSLIKNNIISTDTITIQTYSEFPDMTFPYSMLDKNSFFDYNLTVQNKITKNTVTYKDRDFLVTVNYYDNKELILIDVYAPNNNIDDYFDVKNNKGFIDVSNNELYKDSSIVRNSINTNKIVIEGSKGVGKQGVIDELISRGIICQDRDLKCISNDDVFSLDLDKRCNEYYKRINENKNEYFLFLSLSDTDELKKRIAIRDKIETGTDDFKFNTEYYASSYKESYNYMKERNLTSGKLFLVDCDLLSKEEQIDECLKVVNEIINSNQKKASF